MSLENKYSSAGRRAGRTHEVGGERSCSWAKVNDIGPLRRSAELRVEVGRRLVGAVSGDEVSGSCVEGWRKIFTELRRSERQSVRYVRTVQNTLGSGFSAAVEIWRDGRECPDNAFLSYSVNGLQRKFVGTGLITKVIYE